MTSYTAKQVWGFTHVYAAMPADPSRPDHDYVQEFMGALNRAAAERGVARLDAPSDALDVSRDLIIDEAAKALGAVWAQRGDDLLVTHTALVDAVDWDDLLARHRVPEDGRETVAETLKRAEAALRVDLTVDEADDVLSGLVSELDDLASVGWTEAATLRDALVERMEDL